MDVLSTGKFILECIHIQNIAIKPYDLFRIENGKELFTHYEFLMNFFLCTDGNEIALLYFMKGKTFKRTSLQLQ